MISARHLVLLGLVGLGSVVWMLVQSLAPSQRTLAEAPRTPVGDLRPGAFKFARFPAEGAGTPPHWEGDVLFLREASGSLVALYVPIHEGVHHMPESRSWEPAIRCPDLRVDFQERVIRCGATPETGSDRPVRRWSLEGRKLQDGGVDLEQVRGTEESGDFVFHRPRQR